MTIRHRLDDHDLDFGALRDDLSALLTRQVELLTSRPGPGEPGVLVVVDAATDAHLDLDPAPVAAAIGRHPGHVSDEQRFLVEFDAIRTPPSQHALVIRDYIARKVDAEARVRVNQARARAAIQGARREGEED